MATAKQMVPLVVDLSHHNEVEDWGAVYASGIRAVILKATQGSSFVDPDFAKRRVGALAAGLLVGAYHFADSSDVDAQVAHFLTIVGSDAGTLLALDWEELYDAHGKRARAKEMSLAQVKRFLQAIFDETGQRPILYSGSLIKEVLNGKADPTLSAHRLWLPQYGLKAVLPPGFTSYWLWQYAADGKGPLPHNVPGISTPNIDMNVFGGADLAAEWVHAPSKPAPAPVPGREDATVADLRGASRTVDALVVAKKVGAVVAAVSTAAGVTKETATVAPSPSVLDQISAENLQKISESAGHTKQIVDTTKGVVADIWPGLKMIAITVASNEWLLGSVLGVALVVVADKMLGWRLEEYVFGRWHPNEEPT